MSGHSIAALLPVLILAVGFVGYCLRDVFRQPATRHLPKPVWALVTVLSIPLGGIMYLTVGRPTGIRRVEAGEEP